MVGSDNFFDGTLSEQQPRISSKSHSGLSYLSRSNINDQWYKFIFEDIASLDDKKRQEINVNLHGGQILNSL